MDSCKEITRLVSEGLDRDLSLWERVRIRFHLMMCAGCTNFARQIRMIRGMTRALVEKSLPGRGD